MAIKWQPLMQEDGEDEKDALGPPCHGRISDKKVAALAVLAAVSLVLNVMLAYLLQASPHEVKSAYAGLSWNNNGKWTEDSEYYDRKHKSLSDQNWDKLNWDPGLVAISDEEAALMNLPRSQRFPWDDTKGVYLINGYHNLHCLKWLWITLSKFRDGVEFTWHDWHAFHCVEQLRQDTICSADDTPRYIGEDQENSSGSNQTRQCRDWGALERWAEEHSACYRYLGNSDVPFEDEYKFCPDSSPYKAILDAKFGPNEQERLLAIYGTNVDTVANGHAEGHKIGCPRL